MIRIATAPSGFRGLRPRRSYWSVRLILGGLAIELLLVLADAFINHARWTELGPVRRLFNITREDGLASWFGVTQTWMVALTVWLVFVAVRKLRDSSRWRRAGWLLLAIFFSYMAVDDGAEVHERIGSAYKAVYDPGQLGKVDSEGQKVRSLSFYPSYPWQALMGPLFAAMGIFLLLFLWREMRATTAFFWVLAAMGLFALASIRVDKLAATAIH